MQYLKNTKITQLLKKFNLNNLNFYPALIRAESSQKNEIVHTTQKKFRSSITFLFKSTSWLDWTVNGIDYIWFLHVRYF